MTFDPFGDFDSRGYLRNFFGSKDISKVKALEDVSFQGNLDRAINTLATVDLIEYKHVLEIHKTPQKIPTKPAPKPQNYLWADSQATKSLVLLKSSKSSKSVSSSAIEKPRICS
jgi:hypothetical protein